MSAQPKSLRYETMQLHTGYRPDPTTGARQVPIYATTSYQFQNTDHATRLFALVEVEEPARLARAEFALLRSPHGHDAFLIEDRQVATLVEPFLNRREE